jgi:hypothetical protein
MSDTSLHAPPAPPAAPPRRRRWITVLLCLAIFGGGSVVGASAAARYVAARLHEATLHPEDAPQRIARRVQRRLDLDDAEALRVEAAIARAHGELLEARAEFVERIGPVLDRIEDDVASELPAGKAVLWREDFRRQRAEWMPRLDRPLRLRNR